MQPDDDFQTTLSKWPFVLCDVLLVATALAIAILGDWQLTNWQVASCVISVALGAALFVLPYVVEFQVRVREVREDRTADLRVLQRQIGKTQERVEVLGDLIEALELGLKNATSSTVDLSESLAAVDSVSKQCSGFETDLADQVKRVEALAKELAGLQSSSLGYASATEIQGISSRLEDLQSQVSAIEVMPADSVEAAPPVTPPVREQKVATPQKEKKNRQRRSVEPRMLKRAIELKQDSASVAVSRIIESNSKELDSEPAEAVAERVESDSKVEVAILSEASPVSSAEVAAEETSRSGGDEISVAVAPSVDPTPRVEPDIIDPEHDVKLAESPQPEESESPEVEVEAEVDMFSESVPPIGKKAARIRRNETGVVAEVFIGIGNKPYLRGDGAGLNWETGVAMDFEEIGKWIWIAPVDTQEPFEIQLFRNDEDADRSGKYTVTPGQRLAISPVF